MEKLISLIFSNIFVIIFVVAGIVNFVKKSTASEFKPEEQGQKQFNKPKRKSNWGNVFDFDLEKWIEVQSGQQKTKQKKAQSRPQLSDRSEMNLNRKKDKGFVGSQDATLFSDSNLSQEFTDSKLITGSFEEDNEKQIEVDMSDLQNAVIMAEILGPPRSKRRSIRY
ncbi:MAG: hypothetical protein K0R18_2401 [Bacillales bacterium]|jgi:hypothetical protein|nr:hypothetical protein [Bacillales bacterium]